MLGHLYLQRGFLHKNFCEDNFFHHSSETFFAAAVFDGCSGGKESHFASTLFAKIFRNTCKNLPQIMNEKTLKEILNEILCKSIEKIVETKEILNLSEYELLSTIIFLVGNNENFELIAIGDGFVSVNGKDFVIDQENVPDYLSYHLKNFEVDNFKNWLNFASLRISDVINDVTIATDGILSFQKERNIETQPFDFVHYLAKDEFLIQNPAMLSRKCNILKNQHNLIPADDLTVIRFKKS